MSTSAPILPASPAVAKVTGGYDSTSAVAATLAVSAKAPSGYASTGPLAAPVAAVPVASVKAASPADTKEVLTSTLRSISSAPQTTLPSPSSTSLSTSALLKSAHSTSVPLGTTTTGTAVASATPVQPAVPKSATLSATAAATTAAAVPVTAVAPVVPATPAISAASATVSASPVTAILPAAPVSTTPLAPAIHAAPVAPAVPKAPVQAVAVPVRPAAPPVASLEVVTELLALVDSGTLTAGEAEAFRRQGADLGQALAYAASMGQVSAVLALVEDCSVRMDTDVSQPTDNEIIMMAIEGDWASVAYYLACTYVDQGADGLTALLSVPDPVARKELRQAAGAIRARLPYDLCLAFTKSGHLGPDLFVEQHRWLLPRPKKEEMFLTTDGKKLPEGWYTVVQYPLGDELREAILRKQDWPISDLEAIALKLRGVGETLFCKAAKAKQWALITWILRRCSNAVEMAKQLQEEWHAVWEGDALWRSVLQDKEDLAKLCACLDSFEADASTGSRLRMPWRRGGAVVVPTGAVLRWPSAEILKEALALGKLAIQALKRVGAAEICFALPPSCTEEPRRCWIQNLQHLPGEGEDDFGVPLMHRIAVAGQCELLRDLLDALALPDVCDRKGLTPIAVAACARQWEACEILLDAGCRADSRSGTIALSALQKGSRPAGSSEKEVEHAAKAASLLDKLYERQQRPPAASLTEFFQRQVKGELMHGIEPRRFRLAQGVLAPASGVGPQVWARAVVVGSGLGGEATDSEAAKELSSIVFATLDSRAFEAAQTAEALEVGRLKLLTEDQLLAREGSLQVIAVSVPSKQLVPDAPSVSSELDLGIAGEPILTSHHVTVTEWRRRMSRQVRGRKVNPCVGASAVSRAQVVRPEGAVGGRFAAALPVVARAPPIGTLRVESVTTCCSVGVARIEVLVDGIRLGETAGQDIPELEVLVPPRELEVSLEISGRNFMKERLSCSPPAELRAEVSVAVFVYNVLIDEDTREEFVFVCGHRREMPDEARPFVGDAHWNGGQARLSAMQPLVLGNSDCLELLRSLKLQPDLKPGFRFTPVEWVDTSADGCKACQFERVLINPVRVGAITTP